MSEYHDGKLFLFNISLSIQFTARPKKTIALQHWSCYHWEQIK